MKVTIYVVLDPEYGDTDVFVDKAKAIEHAELVGVECITVFEVTESDATYLTTLERVGVWEEIDEDEEE